MEIIDSLLRLYIGCVSLLAFVLCFYDKVISKNKKSIRVPEKAFFTLSLFGGAWGMLLGMYLFRHKTRHKSFTIIIPILAVLQVVLFIIVMFLTTKHRFYL